MLAKQFNNSLQLAKFILKKERISSVAWLLILLFITVFVAIAFANVFGAAEEMAGIAETMQNPAMVAMVGPVYGLEKYNLGIMYAQMMLLFIAITVAAMNIFLVVNHTRKDEEAGRIELFVHYQLVGYLI